MSMFTKTKSHQGKVPKGKKAKAKAKPKAETQVAVINKMINTALHKQIENKCYQFYKSEFSLRSDAEGGTTNTLILSPYSSTVNIIQGTGQGTRIGNKIKIVKASFDFVIVPNVYDATYNIAPKPMDIVFHYYYDKDNRTISSAPGTDFFQQGSSSGPLTGSLLDALADVNTDRYALLKRVVYKLGNSSNNGSGAAITESYYNNNDYKFNIIRRINLMPMLVKDVIFNDNNANPTSRILLCYVSCLPADGSLANATTNSRPVTMQYVLNYEYEDA